MTMKSVVDMFGAGSSWAAEVSSGVSLPEVLRGWNDTVTCYPREKTVAQVFEDVVEARPNATAVVFGEQQLSYAELNARANQLAHRLRNLGVRGETMVGCCLERSLELIVALVGVLKAGGAYVPVDCSYPKERCDFLLDDTRAPVVLTQKSLASTALAGRGLSLVCLDECVPTEDGWEANPAVAGGPRSLAYVMYTSGSTGRPKGVMIENRAIIRLVRNTRYCHFGADEVFLQMAPVSFDASTFEIWGPLLNGGRLVVMPPHAASLQELGRVIREQRVTTLWLPAGLFNLMVEQQLEDLRPLRQIVAGGDVLSPRHVRMALEVLPNCCLINGYGPTENTTFTCCYEMRPGDCVPETVPIGRPVSNTQVYILDEQGQPLPPGQAGELYAGGDGVARGYLNNSDGTAEKFRKNPFATAADARMYRTGDLARWREDGMIEFLGRVDNQVKILGHRIEPEEVETVLRSHKGVQQTTVVPFTDENAAKRLVAYYVPAGTGTVSPRELRAFLGEKLPQYMIPAVFVTVAAMPLSANGKVDRAALPAPSFGQEDDVSTDYPTAALEQTVVDLWKRILCVDRVGLDENFFDLGGDSLLLVAVHSKLQKILQIEIAVPDLFEFTTVRKLAARLGEKNATAPSFSQVRQQAERQRAAFARAREVRTKGPV